MAPHSKICHEKGVLLILCWVEQSRLVDPMYVLYSLLLTVAALVSSPYWLIRGLRQKKYLRTVSQRISRDLPEVPETGKPLWIHAVSVGEVLAAKVLYGILSREHPDIPVVVSTVTMTGQALAKKELPDAAAHFYFPFDWAFCVRRFLRRIDPRGVVLLETEMWPNFLEGCARSDVPVVIANGRISDKSFRRYNCVRFLTSSMLGRIRSVGAQTEEDRQRFIRLGAAEHQVQVTGNLKFDLAIRDIHIGEPLLSTIRGGLGLEAGDPVIVVGSTMRGEETIFLNAYRRVSAILPRTRLVLAPRHPERFEEVADLIAQSGLSFQRRSRLDQSQAAPADVLLLDSLGELRPVYSLASVAVIGGSFLPFGGHNPLEPAALGKAIVFGPEMSNFKEVARLFLSAGAARQCSIDDLGTTLIELLSDRRASQILGRLAAETLQKSRGAASNTLRLILSELK